LAAALASHFFCVRAGVNMLELLGAILDLLPDFLIDFLLSQLFRVLQEFWIWANNKLL
jgi:hypothetical protein